jgi:hypothetical protein
LRLQAKPHCRVRNGRRIGHCCPDLPVHGVRDRTWSPDNAPGVPLSHVDVERVLNLSIGRRVVNGRRRARSCAVGLIEVNFWRPGAVGRPQQLNTGGSRSCHPRAHKESPIGERLTAQTCASSHPLATLLNGADVEEAIRNRNGTARIQSPRIAARLARVQTPPGGEGRAREVGGIHLAIAREYVCARRSVARRLRAVESSKWLGGRGSGGRSGRRRGGALSGLSRRSGALRGLSRRGSALRGLSRRGSDRRPAPAAAGRRVSTTTG